MNSIKISGIKVTSATIPEIHNQISEFIRAGSQHFILSGNIHGLNLARKHPWLKDFYNKSDLVRVDGAGVVLGARLLGHRISSRSTWADWGWTLAAYLEQKGHSVFFLGGPEGIAEKAADRLKEHAPRLRILGCHHGYFEKQGSQNRAVIETINQCNPDILIVGFGMPAQERWILDNHPHISAKVFITAGAAFEYLAGTVTRCPRWMGEMGMEWVYRLMQNPRRMVKRYLWGNTVFMLNVFIERMIR